MTEKIWSPEIIPAYKELSPKMGEKILSFKQQDEKKDFGDIFESSVAASINI